MLDRLSSGAEMRKRLSRTRLIGDLAKIQERQSQERTWRRLRRTCGPSEAAKNARTPNPIQAIQRQPLRTRSIGSRSNVFRPAAIHTTTKQMDGPTTSKVRDQLNTPTPLISMGNHGKLRCRFAKLFPLCLRLKEANSAGRVVASESLIVTKGYGSPLVAWFISG
jgi:hypothetical protein